MRATKRNGAQQWRTLFPLMGDDRQQGDRQATATTATRIRTATIIMTLAMAKDASPNRKFQSTRSQYQKTQWQTARITVNCTEHTQRHLPPPTIWQSTCIYAPATPTMDNDSDDDGDGDLTHVLLLQIPFLSLNADNKSHRDSTSPPSGSQAHDCLPLCVSVCVCVLGIASLATVNSLVMN